MSMNDLLRQFADPSSRHRQMPFLVLNGIVTPGRITEMLEQYAANGIGGLFFHARPGLVTEYLSQEWFDLFNHTADECRRLGLECHMYDENSWPSGFGGGHTVAQNPLTVLSHLSVTAHKAGHYTARGEVLQTLRKVDGQWTPVEPGVKPAELAKSEDIVTIEMLPAPASLWTGGFPMVDLINPATTPTFIQTTHEQYRRHCGRHFGSTTRYMFTDEPTIGRANYPYSLHIERQFFRDHGYELRPELYRLFITTERSSEVRHDLRMTQVRLFADLFCKPLAAWCERNGLEFTGHFDEHDWPIPRSALSSMYLQRWMHAPGIDLLGFQFLPRQRTRNAFWLLTVKEVVSVAQQTGRRRVLCETAGGGGYDFNPADLKAFHDYMQVHGVNLLNPHLSHMTQAGARKYDWPQTISDHASWWPCYRPLADHDARFNVATTSGTLRHRVLLLHPTTSTWPDYVPGLPEALQDATTANACEALRQTHSGLVAFLAAHHVDFDLGDELILAELGEVAGRQLRVGHAVYDVVVVPGTMTNMLRSTPGLLADLVSAGGVVLVQGAPAVKYLEGRAWAEGQRAALAAGWRPVGDEQALLAAIREVAPPLITNAEGGELPPQLCYMQRALEDGRLIHSFANPWHNETVSSKVRLPGVCATLLDTQSGCASPLPSKAAGDGQIVSVELPAHGTMVVVTSSRPAVATAPTPTQPQWVPVSPKSWRVQRTSPNQLALLFCDLELGDQVHRNLGVVTANEKLWQAQGYPRDMWQWTIQYRRTYIDLPTREDSPFAVTYRFRIAPEALADAQRSLEVAVERPWLYEVTLNDRRLELPERWWDLDMRKGFAGRHAVAGENALVLRAARFQTLHELAPVYVLGDFALRGDEKGHVIAPPRELTCGDWGPQGLPFYPWGVVYRCRLTLARDAAGIEVQLPGLPGSAARVTVDDRPIGDVLYPPYRVAADLPLPAGDHEVSVELMGSMRNMMGPHFSQGVPAVGSWMKPAVGPVAADQHHVTPTGLGQPPTLRVR